MLKIFLLLVCPIFVFGQGTIKATVKAVHDGDSYKVELSDSLKTTFWVRLGDYVDCPEVRSNHICADQPYGKEVGLNLRKKLKGKTVMIDTLGKDIYNRMVVRMWVDGESVTEYILKNGYGWYTPPIGKSDKKLALLRNSAKKLKLGLWGLKAEEIVIPKKFRQDNKCR